MKTGIVGLACAALMACVTGSAVADPIVITSGDIGQDFGLYTTASLTSSAFSFVRLVGDASALRVPGGDGSEPPPKLGDVIDLNATVNGTFVQCNPPSYQCEPVTELNLKLMTAPVLVTPAVLQATHNQGTAFQHRPFTMTGTVGSQEVVGTGFFNLGYADGVDYYFSSPTSSPTPEPTSLLLLGTGIVALTGGRFKHRQGRTADR